MPVQILVENEFITVQYHPEYDILHHTIHKPISGKALFDALMPGGQFLKENGVTKWLSDDRKLPQQPRNTQADGVKQWVEGGLRYWAIVIPEQIESAAGMTPMIDELHRYGVQMRVFRKVEDALQWLIEVD